MESQQAMATSKRKRKGAAAVVEPDTAQSAEAEATTLGRDIFADIFAEEQAPLPPDSGSTSGGPEAATLRATSEGDAEKRVRRLPPVTQQQSADQPAVVADTAQGEEAEVARLREALAQLPPAARGTSEVIDNLGVLLYRQGKLDEAVTMCREAVQAGRETLGGTHVSTLISINKLGSLLMAQSELDEAEPLLREYARARQQRQ